MRSDDSIDDQAVFDVLADADCRDILATVEEPLPAKSVAERCDLPQTSTYRKLQQLSEAGLVAEETEVRPDGHHATTYVRDCSGIFVTLEGDDAFDVETVSPTQSADERLATLWTRVSEEL
ncbi:helix-turn-helix domain-containing protein [Haloarcula onubensis]|uniref:Helix-turn-helix domain-containing protein n=1 Tax=Haloarcula onubensis TaxID=2950539 RepID=A0ABU2FLP9_9EURY|nr:helix-turn-helix domain-containing protein [Halomicroarcula sp. S3CR25-11]MDS0281663.1 helix-turn-helix domain-containing protein [Halomicroarcula sp. S3CR25-11]